MTEHTEIVEDPPAAQEEEQTGRTFAAIDLGSNSFHMVIARHQHGELRTVEKLGEKVQLASGLDEDNVLSEEAQQRGLDCLARFAQRLQGVSDASLRVVATNTLRAASNRQQFLVRARDILNLPVEIISGREEARLIYVGVTNTLPALEERRLVIDIGGGSTEFIIGQRFDPLALESLHMGCVSFTRRFFEDGSITEDSMQRANYAARLELFNIERRYRKLGWADARGSSGTIKAVQAVLQAAGWSEQCVTLEGLEKLQETMLKAGHVDKLQFDGLASERRGVFAAGTVILLTTMRALGIEQLSYADGALREGVLYDLLGRLHDDDVRDRTIAALQERYGVDTEHAAAVEETALTMLEQVRAAWGLEDPVCADWLAWAARAHEIGLAIAHSQFHKHGAYLVSNGDLNGFSALDQQAVGALVRGHRRKWPADEFALLPKQEREPIERLCMLLRLAIVLHHSRTLESVPVFALSAKKSKLVLQFRDDWLDQHPLTSADLEQELRYLKKSDYSLQFN